MQSYCRILEEVLDELVRLMNGEASWKPLTAPATVLSPFSTDSIWTERERFGGKPIAVERRSMLIGSLSRNKSLTTKSPRRSLSR